MDELISRQAAIDALERAKQNIHHNIERAIGDAVCGILDEVENGIKQLPPIQPVNCSEFPNNSDAISRQAAIEVVQNRHMMLSKEKVLLINDLEKLPSAEPKRGKWIDTGGKEEWYAREYRCSECGDTMLGEANYCPNCGADMRGEQDE